MDSTFRKKIQESLEEWKDIKMAKRKRELEDMKLIREFCANNKSADIKHAIKVFQNYDGMPSHDKEIIAQFDSLYPDSLTVEVLEQFTDIQEIYGRRLLVGGEEDD